MKTHRFYIKPGRLELDQKVWVNDEQLVHQWIRVLRMRINEQIILFDGEREDRLYTINKIEPNAVHLTMVTELERRTPKKEIYLCFSLLKKDKNDWVLQKCTELGVSHFVPIISDRTEKMGFDVERAEKIVIEASEQCGRSDIPRVREPIHVSKIIDELNGKANLYVAEQDSPSHLSFIKPQLSLPIAVLVGPEGGWSDDEQQFFIEKGIKHLNLSDFTLRAETACVVAAGLTG